MAVGVLHVLASNEIMAEMVKEDQRRHTKFQDAVRPTSTEGG